jgi:hypothetical protein
MFDGRPAAGGDHLWELVFHRDDGAAEVDGDRRVEGLDVDIGQWARMRVSKGSSSARTGIGASARTRRPPPRARSFPRSVPDAFRAGRRRGVVVDDHRSRLSHRRAGDNPRILGLFGAAARLPTRAVAAGGCGGRVARASASGALTAVTLVAAGRLVTSGPHACVIDTRRRNATRDSPWWKRCIGATWAGCQVATEPSPKPSTCALACTRHPGVPAGTSRCALFAMREVRQLASGASRRSQRSSGGWQEGRCGPASGG